LVPGERYRLAVRDSVGDGMCCDYGEGSIAVRDSVGDGMCCDYGEGSIAGFATVDGVDEILTSSDVSFDASENKVVTVPES
jgi:hypothetical protein